MKKEAQEAKGQVPEHYRKQLLKVQKRVEEATTKVSEKTIRRILGEQEKQEVEGTSFSTPGKTHKVPKRVTDVDDFDKCVIRLTIHEFYVQEKTSQTTPKLLPKLRNRINFKGGSTSLRNIVKELEFQWKKTRNNRVVLIKKHDVRCMRVLYLTALNKYREQGRPIVYEDETYVHSSHTGPKNWSDDCASGLLAPVSKAEILVILHAEGRHGFIPNALVIFKSNQKTGDYHNEMKGENYIRWLKEKLIRNMEPNSVLVIDNAAYHNIQKDKAPTSNSNKKQ
jgi:hypothetical protein